MNNLEPETPAATVEETTQPPASSTVSCLSALEQLPIEPQKAYAVFMRWAMADPLPSITDFADYHNVSRNTITRWRRCYRWDARLRAFHRLRLERHAFVPPEPPPKTSTPPPEDVLEWDFRLEVLDLARSALQRCRESQMNDVSIPTVIRLANLALKLTGQDQRGYAPCPPSFIAELNAALDIAYGPSSRTTSNSTSTVTTSPDELQNGAK